jgi:hypothetical protein
MVDAFCVSNTLYDVTEGGAWAGAFCLAVECLVSRILKEVQMS